MISYNQYTEAISEIALSGEVSLGKVSKSTAYRWAREINDYLAFEKSGWRVKPTFDTYHINGVAGLKAVAPEGFETKENTRI